MTALRSTERTVTAIFLRSAYVTQDNNGDGWFVPGSNDPPAELELDLADAISMDTSAASECQGAEFTVYLAVGT